MAVKIFRPYIEFMPFTIVTDHASLMAYIIETLNRQISYNCKPSILTQNIGKEQTMWWKICFREHRHYIKMWQINMEDILEFETTDFQDVEYLELMQHWKYWTPPNKYGIQKAKISFCNDSFSRRWYRLLLQGCMIP